MKTRDAVAVAVIVLVGLAFGLLAPHVCQVGFDCQSYLGMAANPFRLGHYAPQHAQRILPSLVVYGLSRLGVATPTGFAMVAVLGYLALPLVSYWSLRRRGPPLASVSLTAWLWLAPWQFSDAIVDTGQAGYLWAFVAIVGIALAYEDDRPGVVAAVGFLAAFCRQEMLIPATLALFEIAYLRGRWRPVMLAVLMDAGALAVMIAMTAAASSEAIMSGRILGLSASVAWNALASRRLLLSLWTYLPFLAATRVANAGGRHGFVWITLSSLLIAAFDLTLLTGGPDNVARIAFLAIWPIAWIAAARLVSCRLPTAAWILVTILPLPYAPLRWVLELAGAASLYPSVALVFGIAAPLVAAVLIAKGALRGAATGTRQQDQKNHLSGV